MKTDFYHASTFKIDTTVFKETPMSSLQIARPHTHYNAIELMQLIINLANAGELLGLHPSSMYHLREIAEQEMREQIQNEAAKLTPEDLAAIPQE